MKVANKPNFSGNKTHIVIPTMPAEGDENAQVVVFFSVITHQ